MKQITHTLLGCALAALLPLAAHADKPTPASGQEIEHLITQLKSSGCEFQRNGSWYDSAKAADHLRQKYDYLLKKYGPVTAEDFIANAGSESSMSHKPYQVRCAGQASVASGPWLQAELRRYRSSAGK